MSTKPRDQGDDTKPIDDVTARVEVVTTQESPPRIIDSEFRFRIAVGASLMGPPSRRIAEWSKALDQHYRVLIRSGKPIVDALRARLEQVREQVHLGTDEEAPANGVQFPLFELAPGTQWRDVYMRKVDGHTLFVRVESFRQRFSYFDFGMASERTRAPLKRWEILMWFCEGRGVLPWLGEITKNAVQRQISWLRTSLQAAFGLKDDPFEYVSGTGYRALFRAGAEGDDE